MCIRDSTPGTILVYFNVRHRSANREFLSVTVKDECVSLPLISSLCPVEFTVTILLCCDDWEFDNISLGGDGNGVGFPTTVAVRYYVVTISILTCLLCTSLPDSGLWTFVRLY